MSRRFQFSLRTMLATVSATALVAGISSWLAPETLHVFAIWIQVFVSLFGMLFAGVFATAVVLSCFDLCRRMTSRENDAMLRPQFSIRALLWLILVVAAFLGGMSIQRKRTGPIGRGMQSIGGVKSGNGIATGDQTTIERMTMPDGKRWFSMPSNGELRLYSAISKDGEHEKYMKMPDGSHWRQVTVGNCPVE